MKYANGREAAKYDKVAGVSKEGVPVGGSVTGIHEGPSDTDLVINVSAAAGGISVGAKACDCMHVDDIKGSAAVAEEVADAVEESVEEPEVEAEAPEETPEEESSE